MSNKKKPKKKTASIKRRSLLRVLVDSLKMVASDKGSFLKILATHSIFYFIFVRANSSIDYDQILDQLYGENDAPGGVDELTSVAGATFQSFGAQSTEAQNLYAYGVLTVFSMIYIAFFRQLHTQASIDVKNILYRSTKQLIPFILVSSVILLQLIPLFLAVTVAAFTLSSAIDPSFVQQFILFLVAVAGSSISLYLVSARLPSLFAVTLDGSNPLDTIREVRKLLQGRRFYIATAILFFLALAIVIFGILFLCAVLIAGPTGGLFIMDIAAVLSVPLFLTFFFEVYKELIIYER